MLSKKYSDGSSASSSWSGRTDSLNPSLDLYTSTGGLEDPILHHHKCCKSSFVPPTVTLNSSNSSSQTLLDPGNGLGQALNLGTFNGRRTLSDAVSSTDLYDYYQLNLSAKGNLNIVLDGLSADANLQLFNSHGTLIGNSFQLGMLPESINLSETGAGTYYVRVSQYSGSTNYNLSLSTDYAGNTLSAARDIGTLNGTQTLQDFVGSSDSDDYYRLNLSTAGSLSVRPDGLSANINLQLLNSNGIQLGNASQVGNTTQAINFSGLAAGTYYVRLYPTSGDTNYSLSLSTSQQSEANQPLTAQTGSSINTPIPPSTSTALSSPFTSFSVGDASGDNTANTVFQGGAIRLSYNYQGVASPSNIRLEALSNGNIVSTFELGSGSSSSNKLINLASVSSLTAGDYQFRLVATINDQNAFSNTQSIKILTNSRINGTFTADSLAYLSELGTGAIFLGLGGTDTLDLSSLSINSSNITSINGLSVSAFNPLSGSTTNQAIYHGTAFDYITLSDGREIYFQGIEYLRFTDGTTLELQVRPNDTYFSSQWNLAVSDVPSAWRFTQGASNVLLVSLDTGILTAVGASGGIVDINTNRLITDTTDDDNYNDYGHGHSAISIMSSSANNSSGIAGINWNSSVYVTDVYSGVSLQQAIQDAINYAKANNMKVVFQGGIQGDYWLTSGGTQAQLEQLIKDNSDNAIFAIAAGNGGVTADLNTTGQDVNGVAKLQSTHNNMISVGALQKTGTATVNNMTNATAVDLPTYSNRGTDLTLVAATDSPAMDKFGNMNFFTGTSAANPNLAGIASLVWSVNPSLTAAQVRQILVETAMDLGTTGRDNTFGSGLVNADAAVRRAVALQRNLEVANLYSGNVFV
ncbi:MAG: S8 family serine peptidase [Cyanobacteriota bacterium]